MAKAYACDRCDELFRESDFSDYVPVILKNDVQFNARFINISGTQLALCPKCRASFQKWWDEGAVHKTTEPRYQYVETLYEVDEGGE